MLLRNKESVKVPETSLDIAGILNSCSGMVPMNSPIRWHFLKAHLEKDLSEFMPHFIHYILAQPLCKN